ncbi:MAG: sulfate reduction electron transfer complex DsrMKJOP subunit DsrJ [Desulfobacterales bacterium]
MNDKYKIYTGLFIFIAMVTFPFWYNLGKAAPVPEIKLSEKAKAAGACVRPVAYMKTQHMTLLDAWRDSVVRDGKRAYVNGSGKEFRMSLTDTCLGCHSERAAFCDRCHNYVSVKLDCWNCHIDPKENA